MYWIRVHISARYRENKVLQFKSVINEKRGRFELSVWEIESKTQQQPRSIKDAHRELQEPNQRALWPWNWTSFVPASSRQSTKRSFKIEEPKSRWKTIPRCFEKSRAKGLTEAGRTKAKEVRCIKKSLKKTYQQACRKCEDTELRSDLWPAWFWWWWTDLSVQNRHLEFTIRLVAGIDALVRWDGRAWDELERRRIHRCCMQAI